MYILDICDSFLLVYETQCEKIMADSILQWPYKVLRSFFFSDKLHRKKKFKPKYKLE